MLREVQFSETLFWKFFPASANQRPELPTVQIVHREERGVLPGPYCRMLQAALEAKIGNWHRRHAGLRYSESLADALVLHMLHFQQSVWPNGILEK